MLLNKPGKSEEPHQSCWKSNVGSLLLATSPVAGDVQSQPTLQQSRQQPRQPRTMYTNRLPVTAEEIKAQSHLPMIEAANAIGVSISKLKRLCRSFQIGRWPSRLVRKQRNVGLQTNLTLCRCASSFCSGPLLHVLGIK
jgi:hypothetical protein